ncbi:MAG: hypothetical protein HKN21_14115 [Candidatus Eisenbacteria bacterium]|uniref:Uncharacterized protein n=1 Tax=Eiseniibacteriota bacterium TaxID=2212470 RepID=A0A7Y2H3C0_UNCEI|nr:hypothetical protein [Candidatus Eisenbacteria bacterium]
MLYSLSLSAAAYAGTIKGQANYEHHIMGTCAVEFILVYSAQTKKGTISWRHTANPKGEARPELTGPFFEAQFVVTQLGDIKAGKSLVGFGVDRGYPLCLRVDVWAKGAPFYLHDPFAAPGAVAIGRTK